MRGVVLPLVAALVPMAGCVDALLAPEPDESVDVTLPGTTAPTTTTPAATTTPVTTVTPTPMPGPTPTPTPTTQPTPTPTPPTPSTTPTPTPTPAPTPTPTPTPMPTPDLEWPREGSTVTFRAHTRQSFSGSEQRFATYVNATWTFSDGDWGGVCTGNHHNTDDGGTETITPVHREYRASDPPHWPLFMTRSPPAEGQTVTAWRLDGCDLEPEEWSFVGEDEVDWGSGTVATYRAESDERDIPYDFAVEWSQESGLVLEWSKIRGHGTMAPWSSSGALIATDAPL